MKRVMVIEVVAKQTFDEDAEQFYDTLTPEQRAERTCEMKADVQRLFRREMDDGAEITVNVTVKEDAE